LEEVETSFQNGKKMGLSLEVVREPRGPEKGGNKESDEFWV